MCVYAVRCCLSFTIFSFYFIFFATVNQRQVCEYPTTSMTNTLLYGDGPLANAWLAANLDKKLSKQQYLKTSIIQSTKAIETSSDLNNRKDKDDIVLVSGESDSQLQFPTQVEENGSQKNNDNASSEPITLRISGQLLYGVIKIYSRKTRYLYDDVSLALIQLKSTFAISKTINMPIKDTIISSLNQITLNDKITEANILYDYAENFDINKIFNGSVSSVMDTQIDSSSVVDNNDDYDLGDISIGRNNIHDNSEITHNSTINLPEFGNNVVEGDGDVGNVSIDALARRAEAPMDDLDHVTGFDLPLDLDLNKGKEDGDNVVMGISDYQLEAVDNMDLEFSIDETANEQIEPNLINDTLIEPVDEGEDDGEEIEYSTIKHKRRRKSRRQTEYKNTDVIRTQRKRIVIDESTNIATDVLKKNQREYPKNLKLNNGKDDDKEKIDNGNCLIIMNSLTLPFLQNIGSSWKSIKRRKLIEGNENIGVHENDEGVVKEAEEEGEIPDFSAMPEFNNEPPEAADNEGLGYEPMLENIEDEAIASPEPEVAGEPDVELMGEEEGRDVELEGNNFDTNYEELKNSNKTTIEIAQELRKEFESKEEVSFGSMLEDNKFSLNSTNLKSNKTRIFFELLVLGTENTISLKQDRLFGDIAIRSKSELLNKFL